MDEKDMQKIIDAVQKKHQSFNIIGVLQALVIAGGIGLYTKIDEAQVNGVVRAEKVQRIQHDIEEIKNDVKQTQDEVNKLMQTQVQIKTHLKKI